ncbi:LacI family transcriptional regulator [Paenibacillus sp. TRM 82003]|nr:LacI family transcriptional regulator [Paenibacillus sp. TRM 82003]
MTNMDDVAKAAGVSKSTVSNVFSGKRPISGPVTEKVLAVARELNYRPNYFARSMVTKETGNIGIVMDSEKVLFNQYNLSFFNGVLKECHRQGYRLLVDTVSDRHREQVSRMTSEPIDGAIVLDPSAEDRRIADRAERGMRLVVIGRPPVKLRAPLSYVDNDNAKAAERAAAHLIALGHREVLFINAVKRRTVSQDRKEGFLEAFRQAGLPVNEERIVCRDDSMSSSEFGYRETLRRLREQPEITAIVADTDKVALGTYRAAAELGRSIPNDLSVIAFNNDTVYPSEFSPPLTCIELSGETLGREAARLLIEQAKAKENAVRQVIVQSRLEIRESCGPAPQSVNE